MFNDFDPYDMLMELSKQLKDQSMLQAKLVDIQNILNDKLILLEYKINHQQMILNKIENKIKELS